MVRFSSNIVVVSIIIVGITLIYASTEKDQNGKEHYVAEKSVYGDAGFKVGRGNAIIPMAVDNQNVSSKNNEPEPEKEVLSRKEFTGKGAFRVGIENTVEIVNGKPVIKQTLFGHIGGQLSITKTLNDCQIELQKHFGENCVVKNKAKLCANRAMVALTLSDLPDGVAKMYFEILMANIIENSAMDIEEFCENRFKKLEKDLKYVLSLVKMSDLPNTADTNYQTKLYHGVLKKGIEKCLNNLQLFKKVDFYDPGYKTRCILKNAFKNIKLINLKNTDEIDYFIDNIFKRFHIKAVVPNPEKFCLIHKDYGKSIILVKHISDKQDSTSPGAD